MQKKTHFSCGACNLSFVTEQEFRDHMIAERFPEAGLDFEVKFQRHFMNPNPDPVETKKLMQKKLSLAAAAIEAAASSLTSYVEGRLDTIAR